jgi:hypothetical protein
MLEHVDMAAMIGKTRDVDGIPFAVEETRQVRHFRGRTGKPVDQQERGTGSARKAKTFRAAAVGDPTL